MNILEVNLISESRYVNVNIPKKENILYNEQRKGTYLRMNLFQRIAESWKALCTLSSCQQHFHRPYPC